MDTGDHARSTETVALAGLEFSLQRDDGEQGGVARGPAVRCRFGAQSGRAWTAGG